jgi:hypothetical protein
MGRPERPLDPTAGSTERFAHDLRQLRRSAGTPTYRGMAARVPCSATALSMAASGRSFPSWEVTRAFVLACGGEEKHWAQRWASAEHAAHLHAPSTAVEPLGEQVRTQPPAPSGHRNHHLSRRVAVAGILVLCVLIGGTVVGMLRTTAPPAPETHSQFLGQADLVQYCHALGYTDLSLDGPTAYDWHCTRPPAVKDSLSVIEGCRQQYHRATATARYAEIANPDSWQCWDNVVVLGRVNLAKYCQSQGYTSASLAGVTADKWSCVSTGRRSIIVDPDSACRWQYGSVALVATVAHFRAPWEHWECWG